MPYILSPIISNELPGLWKEGSPYKSETIYDFDNPVASALSNRANPQSPPVRYQAHTLKPHSLPHLDAPGHILKNGHSVDWFYQNNKLSAFYGQIVVIRFKDIPQQNSSDPNIHVNEVSKETLKNALEKILGPNTIPDRLIITLDDYPETQFGTHDPNYVLVLSAEAAEWLVSANPNFTMYGTSWKSTDYQPNSSERPIHKIFLSKNIALFECLKLTNVPEGIYFWMSFPLPLKDASESPVCPVLFRKEELLDSLDTI